MVKQFKIKSDLLNEDLDVIRVKYTNCYKVIIRGKESKVQITKKYVDFENEINFVFKIYFFIF